MKLKELKGLSIDELKDKLDQTRKQVMELGFKKTAGVEKPHVFKQGRQTIARIMTLINEKSRGSK